MKASKHNHRCRVILNIQTAVHLSGEMNHFYKELKIRRLALSMTEVSREAK